MIDFRLNLSPIRRVWLQQLLHSFFIPLFPSLTTSSIQHDTQSLKRVVHSLFLLLPLTPLRLTRVSRFRVDYGAMGRPRKDRTEVGPVTLPAEDLSADDDLLSWVLVDQLGALPNTSLGVFPQQGDFVGPSFDSKEILDIVRQVK